MCLCAPWSQDTPNTLDAAAMKGVLEYVSKEERKGGGREWEEGRSGEEEVP